MTVKIEKLRAYFKQLQLDPEVADIYHTLHLYGPQTISELARNSGIKRIQIYRLLDHLKDSGLIEIEMGYKRSILHAAPINKIQLLITQREQELKDLQGGYQSLVEHYATQSLQSHNTRVQFYEGIDGIKQTIWNQTKGKSENLSLIYEHMPLGTNSVFFDRWTHTCNERGLRFRSIVNDHFISTRKNWRNTHSNDRLQNWQGRLVPSDIFPIPYSVITYDDTVLHYNWNDQKMFAIEIHNPAVAQIQRQLFEVLWQQATPLKSLE